jgi:hypothetical protein
MFIPDPGSDFFPSRIPEPNCLHPGSRILIKEFKYFNPKKPKKWFLSSKKYDPGCSSRIRMLTFYPSRIPDPGSRGQKGTRSRIRIRNTGSICNLGPDLDPAPAKSLDSIRFQVHLTCVHNTAVSFLYKASAF